MDTLLSIRHLNLPRKINKVVRWHFQTKSCKFLSTAPYSVGLTNCKGQIHPQDHLDTVLNSARSSHQSNDSQFNSFKSGLIKSERNQNRFSDCRSLFSKGFFSNKARASLSVYFHSWSSRNLKSDSKMELESSTSKTTTIGDLARSSGGLQSSSVGLPACEVAMMKDAKEVFKHAVNSVLPKEMVAKHLILDSSGDAMTVDNVKYLLNHNVYLVGFGKAVLGMARAVDDLIGQHIVRGVVSVPHGTRKDFSNAGKTGMLLDPSSPIEVREGASNNMPDQPAHEAALEIADLARSVGNGDLLVVLISGGGSALLPAPDPPITLSDLLSVTSQMSRGGATISQLNTVRKQLDFLKGGGLATLAYPAQVVSLILSDIVGDHLDFIASAPTVADTSTPESCLSLFTQLNIADKVPKTVKDFLKEKSKSVNIGRVENSDSLSKMPKSLEMSHVKNMLIGSNKIACERACQESCKMGYSPFVLSTELEGEAKEIGKMFAELALFIVKHIVVLDDNSADIKEIRKRLTSKYKLSDNKLDEIVFHVENSKMASQGICIVAGGETTVTVSGTGRGGRNQEMATSAGLELDKIFKELRGNWNSNDKTPQVVFLSAGTDGQDGPTPAAGGVVGLHFVGSVNRMGLNPRLYLDNNDSFTLLNSWADGVGLVNTGLTGTNVMDLQLLMIKRPT